MKHKTGMKINSVTKTVDRKAGINVGEQTRKDRKREMVQIFETSVMTTYRYFTFKCKSYCQNLYQ